MSFIKKIREITEVNRAKIRTCGTKKIIKKTKKQIQYAAKEGKYDAVYFIPSGLLFYENNIEHYFTKEGFTCSVNRNCCEYFVKVSWKEEE